MTEQDGKVVIMVKEYKKLLMHKAIHHLPSNFLPVPEQQLPPPRQVAPSPFQHDVKRYGVFLCLVGVRSPSSVPFQLPVHSQPPCWQSSMRS